MTAQYLLKYILLILLLHSSALVVGSDVANYAREVHQDKPVALYAFSEKLSADGSPLRNASMVVSAAPDAVYSQAVQLQDGPVSVGPAAGFSGTGYFEIPDHAFFNTGELSVEFWVRSSQTWDQPYWPGSATLISKFTGGWASGDWGILGGSLTAGVNEGRILVGIGPKGGGDVVLASRPGLNDGRFHHVVWVRTREGRNALYVDGTPQASADDHGTTIANTRAIQVGGEKSEPNGTFLKGSIAALAIYTYPLPEARIRAHFAAGQLDPRLPPPAKQVVDFATDIKPLFQQYCYHCHGPGEDQGGLSLATRNQALMGGDSGSVILPGRSSQSALVLHVAALDETRVMPPEGERLTAEQVGLLRAWIDQGAVWPANAEEPDPRLTRAAEHWAYKPLRRPALPDAQPDDWVTSPVDAFVLAGLQNANLQPAPQATKAALLRRACFDLTGLPPTPDEIRAFEQDSRPEAWEEVVDRLLNSAAYGERWARHWLDVVRYADSGGYETDIRYEQAWRYRDYVIRSLNEDKPYDRFLQEQVAGDELWPEDAEAMQEAVAVWTLGQWPNALDKFPEMLEYMRRTDQVTTFSESMLGLTVGCANCHSHKYDPIRQQDYFGLEAIFAASETWDRNTNKKSWSSGERTHFRIFRHASTPTPIHLLTRGELSKPRGLVLPSLPAFLPGGGPLPDVADESRMRRAHLARWLVSPQNPLTARVIVNRVWQWHFGQPLAGTPNVLGMQGQKPSHPELLDWLATELVENGWRLKPLHRLLLLSSAWRQSAIRDSAAVTADPANRLYSGFSRRRMDAEEVWDHLHATSGVLNRKSFGPPFVPSLSAEEMQGIYDIEGNRDEKWPVTQEQHRRAIYILNRRSFRFPFFEAFDPANSGASCPVRQTSTVPTQALTLLNNSTVATQAKVLAERLAQEAGPEPEQCVRLAWLLCCSREVTPAELPLALKFLTAAETSHSIAGTENPHAAALADFCMAVLNTTEFIYIN